jgi:tetratricopeptide (TPR) repeat protein
MKHRTNRLLAPLALLLVLAAAPVALADYEQALSYFKAGKYVEAAAEFQALVDQSPSYDYGYYLLGLSFMQMGKPQDAEQNFQKAIELNGEKFEFHHGLAQAYFQTKQYGKSIAALKTAEGLAADGNQQFALYKLRGFSYIGLEKWPDAIEDLDRAKAIESSPAILDRLGQAYYALNHYDKAAPVLREALKAAPDNVANLTRLTNTLMSLGAETRDEGRKKAYYQEALDVAERFQKADPGNAEAHNLVGRAALGAKDYGKAEQAFKRVLAQKSDQCYAMVNLGKTYIATENWTDAESILTDAARCAPRLPVIYESLGYSLQKQKRLAEAIETYKKATSIKPSAAVDKLIATCEENLRIAEANKAMDEEERKSAEEARKAQEEYEEQLAKQKEWEEKRKRDE